MVKILGLSDIFTAVLLLSKIFDFYSFSAIFLVVFSVYVILKGFMFMPDAGSIVDIISGIALILSLFITMPGFILVPLAVILGIKGIFSLFA